jgi:hypothetical protein
MKQIEMAMDSYKQEFGYYVQSPIVGGNPVICSLMVERDTSVNKGDFTYFLDFETLKTNNTNVGTISGTKTWYTFIDAYGTALRYRCPGRKNKTSFDLGSLGPDARYGDVSNYSVTESNENNIYGKFGQGDDITNFTP